jgi:hypothetical protein
VSSDSGFDPFLYALPELDFSGVALERCRVGVYHIGSAIVRKAISKKWYFGKKDGVVNLGSSVASSLLSIPMIATSAISGCSKSTLSNSAGETMGVKSNRIK